MHVILHALCENQLRLTELAWINKVFYVYLSFFLELCMKDLLLIVDTSNSVRAYFESDMKPFLKLLVKDRELRVSVNGTQIALMIFSEKEKTEVKLNFGITYDAEGVAKLIDDLKWDDVKGGFTRTDYAFEIANEKVNKNTVRTVLDKHSPS